MKNMIALGASVLLLATPTFAESTAEIVNSILGKPIYAADTKIVIKKNGRMSGSFKGQKIGGKWAIEDGLFCRSMTLGGKDLGASCQKFKRVKNGVKVTDVKGANRKPRTYTFTP